ncbi:hypothetical protein DB31_3380 [Hyalangium minutum]|uniref:Uncharacterized protein n=1 Tax=Hyalangium minutum TaxID=394096 RepID=A0A085WU87_9BACT|nr:hypothetical protein DB31_3380 [Hyalangium minutum]
MNAPHRVTWGGHAGQHGLRNRVFATHGRLKSPRLGDPATRSALQFLMERK